MEKIDITATGVVDSIQFQAQFFCLYLQHQAECLAYITFPYHELVM